MTHTHTTRPHDSSAPCLVRSTDADKGYVFDGFDEFRRAKRSAPEPTVTVNQSLDLDDGKEPK